MSKIEDEWKPQTIWTLVQILLICEMCYTAMVEKLITHAWYGYTQECKKTVDLNFSKMWNVNVSRHYTIAHNTPTS